MFYSQASQKKGYKYVDGKTVVEKMTLRDKIRQFYEVGKLASLELVIFIVILICHIVSYCHHFNNKTDLNLSILMDKSNATLVFFWLFLWRISKDLRMTLVSM